MIQLSKYSNLEHGILKPILKFGRVWRINGRSILDWGRKFSKHYIVLRKRNLRISKFKNWLARCTNLPRRQNSSLPPKSQEEELPNPTNLNRIKNKNKSLLPPTPHPFNPKFPLNPSNLPKLSNNPKLTNRKYIVV